MNRGTIHLLIYGLLAYWAANARAVTVDNFLALYYTNAQGVLPYRLFIPTNYNAGTRYPLTLFLHGSGERGSDNRIQLRNDGCLVFASETNQLVHPSFMVAPQCPANDSWDDLAIGVQVLGMMNALMAEFSIDTNRLYITGLSMGGYGTWYYIAWYPNMYAAAIPMSGGGDPTLAPGMTRIPIWDFHAFNDGTVPVSESRTMINAVRAAGGNPIYTEYGLGGHGIWTTAYDTPILMDWVYAQRLGTNSSAPPLLSIKVPTDQPIYAATSTNLALGGTSMDGNTTGWTTALSSVNWTNYGQSVSSGVATGTTNWTITNVVLNSTVTNLILVTGTGTSWAGLLGRTTFNDTLTVIFPPSITTQPQNQAANQGDTVTFSVSVTPAQALTYYQWRFNGFDLTGRTNASLTLTDVQMADAGVYSVRVKNPFGMCTSSDAALGVRSVAGPCIALGNPDFEGGFTLTGGSAIANHWTEWEANPAVVTGYDETGIILGGGHAQRISVSGGTNGASGGLYQRVPVLTGQTYTASVWTYAGDAFTSCFLGVDPAGGTDPSTGVTWSSAAPHGAWQQQTWTGTATADHLTVYLKVASADGVERNGYFDGAIPEGCEIAAPLITSQPASQAVFQGMTASFTVGATSHAAQFYQWQFDNGSYQTNLTDGGGISGCGAATLTVSNVSPANVGGYSVVVTNVAGSVTNTVAFLGIVPWRPIVTVPPVSQAILPGATTTFTVAAVGSQPFSYRWQKDGISLNDGSSIVGSATRTLTVSNASAASVGTYSVVVSNSLGSATSAGAVLALIPVTVPGVALDTLYSFADTTYGFNPYAGLIQANDGNFYGTALNGGMSGDGTAYRMTTNGVVSLAHAFSYTTDGAQPYAPLTQGTDGSLYGVNAYGGQSGAGTVFRMTTNGVVTILTSLDYTTRGGYPEGGLVQGRDGNFYGPTLYGGPSGYGTLFRVTSANAFSTLSSFNYDNGAYSSALLVQAADGNLYGTTQYGGTTGDGTVFRTTPAGVITPLASFNYGNGEMPVAGLVQDTDGTFYGTTYYGGTNGWGTVFKMAADGTLTSLHSFRGGADGANPYGGLLLSRDGNLYGTTESGGTYSHGTVFRMSPDGTLVTLAHLDGYQGANPEGALVQDADGNLYGTTANGGQAGQGAIFRLSINAPLQITRQPQTQMAFLGENVAFSVATYGRLPVSYQWRKNGQNLSDAGNLSGASARTLILTNLAVTDAANYSVVVSNASGSITSATARLEILVSPPYIVSGPEDQTVLLGASATFSVEADGDEPLSFQWQQNGTNLTEGGNIMGSSTSTLTVSNTSAASVGTYSVIVSNPLDWISSEGALLTVVPPILPSAYYSRLHPFTGGGGGLNPSGGVIQAKNAPWLYGTTLNGGASDNGTAFKMATSGSFAVLHSFTYGSDGSIPEAGLVQGSDGNFYGTTSQGGSASSGTVFKMTSAGTVTSLYSFLGGNDGSHPIASLIQGADGKLYGTAHQGGTNGAGSVFSLTTNGAFVPLVSFDWNKGFYPMASLVQAANGLFYGTTSYGGTNGAGTVFTLTTNGVLTTLVSFKQSNGASPVGALIQASDGLFYGTTSSGGTNGGWGTVFRMIPDGTLTTLYSFGYDDGAKPEAGLVQGTDGNFYGTTSEGGWCGQGTVFRLTTNGVLTTLVWFNGVNGAEPQSPLIQLRDGSFCGTAACGGTGYNGGRNSGDGLVFRLILPMFLSNAFTQDVATVGVPYGGSLATNSIRPPGGTVLFAKLDGPAWLNVDSDGTLSGTPALSDLGTNTFTVNLSDTNGWACAATMRIPVVASPCITASIVGQGSTLWLTWFGRTPPYQVQMATDLKNPVWVNITGPLNTNSMPLTPTGAAFYRIQGQ